MARYYRFSEYLKEKYGVKTYKLPVNLDFTCPNRDGFLSSEGCFFCGADGAAFEKSGHLPVKEQLLDLKDYIGDKYNAEKFIAYFQNFSNTYLPLPELKQYVQNAMEVDDIVEVALSTRPDCINEKYLNELTALIKDSGVNLTLELGLQTVNYHTLQAINRQHTLAEFIDTMLRAHKFDLDVGVHLILNLPGDDRDDVIENAKILSALKVSNVKLHALYIRKNTRFAEMYKNDELEIIPVEEYVDRVVTFLEYLDPEIAVQRLLGRAPEEKTLFVNWGYYKQEVENMIKKELKERDVRQGDKFDYLDGKALNKFS
ncbi:MAG: TIGR01212 family radical SAM protein [Bacillota bacterium]